MPELIPSNSHKHKNNEILVLQNKLLDLKKKLLVETQMYEAAKLIKVRMDKERHVQQVENSLKESSGRIGFIEEQIKEVEMEIYGFRQLEKEEASVSSDYLDAIDSSLNSMKISSSPSVASSASCSTNPKQPQTHTDLKCFLLANQKLFWSKIDYKIAELTCRLKVSENILQAEEKIIEAFKRSSKSGGGGAEDIKDLVEVSKQRVQILQQALKKYTSLISSNGPPSATPTLTPIQTSDDQLVQFTGKLLIKVTKIGGFSFGTFSSSSSWNPVTLSFNLNQFLSLSTPNNPRTSNSSIHSVITSASKDPDNSTLFTCYQEINVNLVKASDLELTISTATATSGTAIKGMFFAKLAALFTRGPDEEASLSESFEIEPSGTVDLQFHYSKQVIIILNI